MDGLKTCVPMQRAYLKSYRGGDSDLMSLAQDECLRGRRRRISGTETFCGWLDTNGWSQNMCFNAENRFANL